MNEAIYAGSFDPITNGHVDIIQRALNHCSKIFIGVLSNPEKTSLFSTEERIAMIRESFKDNNAVVVEGFTGLLVDYAREKNVYTMIRGLRAVSDFDYEFQMSLINRSLENKIDTIFFMTDSKYSYISSSLIKQLSQFQANVADFVPAHVEVCLKEKFS
jgi:pantetheine-phosphate adenylyltransferase